MVRYTDRPAITIAVDLGREATKPANIEEKKLKTELNNFPSRKRFDFGFDA